jgi:hypothetical protein
VGESFDARCSNCGEIFNISIGGGFRFMMLHCEVCGKPKARNIAEKIELGLDEAGHWGTCPCGGDLSFDAPPRCPKCRSTKYEVPGNYVNYD